MFKKFSTSKLKKYTFNDVLIETKSANKIKYFLLNAHWTEDGSRLASTQKISDLNYIGAWNEWILNQKNFFIFDLIVSFSLAIH